MSLCKTESPYSRLKRFLTDAAAQVTNAGPLANEIFIELRYHRMAKAFPHDVFSVNQANNDFFTTALAHLEGAPFDEAGKDQSTYELNYRRWIRMNRDKSTNAMYRNPIPDKS